VFVLLKIASLISNNILLTVAPMINTDASIVPIIVVADIVLKNNATLDNIGVAEEITINDLKNVTALTITGSVTATPINDFTTTSPRERPDIVEDITDIETSLSCATAILGIVEEMLPIDRKNVATLEIIEIDVETILSDLKYDAALESPGNALDATKKEIMAVLILERDGIVVDAMTNDASLSCILSKIGTVEDTAANDLIKRKPFSSVGIVAEATAITINIPLDRTALPFATMGMARKNVAALPIIWVVFDTTVRDLTAVRMFENVNAPVEITAIAKSRNLAVKITGFVADEI